ncbi:YidC/Oxa1 family membrane protein insertase [Alkaliphilus pronyensis]|uniref:YidC/Oxa1 family membrane protein insertase n=1 Tax=Alkaliphilus pronyensis TaxID=1482732 RepID=A0A6I0F6A8_9FIRM|nr:YidC/Oxa1 family membrane protein insertase [Alkaliphilus pronyensis]KAB3530778.1 YidC/Oxa1 family membrane protein insertase [Alkaliphilus pronyensis]
MDILVKPLGALLKIIFDIVGNYGFSIIIFTVIVKLAMIPLTLKQTKSMRRIQEINPELKALQEKYKNDQEKLNIKVAELYKKHNVSLSGGCLPLIIQLPIIIALFTVLRNPIDYGFSQEVIQAGFLWIANLSEADPWILPLIAGFTTYLTSITASTDTNSQQNSTTIITKYFMPIMIFWWGRSFPAGLTLYWGISNIFQLVQQISINRYFLKQKELSSNQNVYYKEI